MTTIKFSSIAELVDFQMTANMFRCTVDPDSCTLTGPLGEAELELARLGYDAEVVGRHGLQGKGWPTILVCN